MLNGEAGHGPKKATSVRAGQTWVAYPGMDARATLALNSSSTTYRLVNFWEVNFSLTNCFVREIGKITPTLLYGLLLPRVVTSGEE